MRSPRYVMVLAAIAAATEVNVAFGAKARPGACKRSRAQARDSSERKV